MKLGEILSAKHQSGLVPSVMRPVEFKVIGKGKGSGEHVTTSAKAILAIVSEEERMLAQRDANEAVISRYGERHPVGEAFYDEHVFQMLARAMRDADDPRGNFATADELRKALARPVAMELYSTYLDYEREEFPDRIDEAMMKKLVDDAKKKSAADLLCAYGSSLILKALPTLARACGAPREPSTSVTASV